MLLIVFRILQFLNKILTTFLTYFSPSHPGEKETIKGQDAFQNRRKEELVSKASFFVPWHAFLISSNAKYDF